MECGGDGAGGNANRLLTLSFISILSQEQIGCVIGKGYCCLLLVCSLKVKGGSDPLLCVVYS